MNGAGIVTVANYFSWLDYLDDPAWESWFPSAVTGAKVGSWEESSSPQHTTATGSRYEIGVDGGTVYIGYSPDTRDIFDGTLGTGGIEPGCKGL